MLERKHTGDPIHQRKILFILDRPSEGKALCNFLHSMGCACVAATSREALIRMEQETFDVILFDLAGSQSSLEKMIQAIREVRATLVERILLLTGDNLAEVQEHLNPGRFNLPAISQEQSLLQLWEKLEEIFAAQQPPKSAPPGMHTARLIFDSLSSPTVAGVRGSLRSARQLAYQHESTTVNLLIHPKDDNSRLSLAGQVLDLSMRAVQGLPVILSNRHRTMAQTTTSQFGEFGLEFDFVEHAGLQIRLSEGSWIYLPFENRDRLKNSISELDAGT
jgi:CheY-like chemotaxis protein